MMEKNLVAVVKRIKKHVPHYGLLEWLEVRLVLTSAPINKIMRLGFELDLNKIVVHKDFGLIKTGIPLKLFPNKQGIMQQPPLTIFQDTDICRQDIRYQVLMYAENMIDFEKPDNILLVDKSFGKPQVYYETLNSIS